MGLINILAGMKQKKTGLAALKHFEAISQDPMKTQKEFLFKLLEDNKDTEYGKKYGFADIHTIEDYQKKVPLTVYDDYEEYIKRMSDNCERNLITAYEMALYNKTSGSVGEPKRIPMTKVSLERFMLYNNALTQGVVFKRFGSSVYHQRTLSLTLSNPNIKTMKDGITFGAVSDTAGNEAKPVWNKLFTSPLEASYPQPGTNTRYLHARYGLVDGKITQILCSFMSFTLELFRYIENNWEMIVSDIEKGTISESIELPEGVRESLCAKLKPDPKRAAFLKSVFEKGFDKPFAPIVWPNLKVILGAATGSFKEYADKMKERYTGDIPIYRRGVSASEGAFSQTMSFDSCDSVLLPDSVFYEFLPEGQEFGDGTGLLTLDKLETGKKYELVITNLSGFYRYRMKDVFIVKGKYNNTPTIEFQYRSDKTVSIMGEKTTEQAIRYAASQAAEKCGFSLIESTVYPDIDNSRYVYIIEAENIPENVTREDIRATLQECLAKANPSMGDKMARGLCAPIDLKFSQPETFILYREMLQMKGYSVGQIKPVTVITNETQRKFFFTLTE